MIVGLDEAGRGSFFGRIYAAAVYIPDNLVIPDNIQIKDSKKMTKKNRNKSYDFLINNVIYGIGFVEPEVIDKIGIQRANIQAFHDALDELQNKLNEEITYVYVDGIFFEPWKMTQFKCIPQGDNLIKEISIASIIAKVSHDTHIETLVTQNPELEKYGLHTNMGYGTKTHRDALGLYGFTEFHRKTFIKNYSYKN